MDILSHAVAGAASGAVFGHPVIGAVVAVMPDAVLGLKRRSAPTLAYRYSHSLLVVLCATVALALAVPPAVAKAVALAWLSHVVLDIPTHGALWAPRVLFPLTQDRVGRFTEWEFGNLTWYAGLLLTATWSMICLATLP